MLSQSPAPPLLRLGTPQGSAGAPAPTLSAISVEPLALPVELPTLPAEPPTLPVEPPALPAGLSPIVIEPTARTDVQELWELALGHSSKEGGIALPQASLEDCLASFQQTADVFERETVSKEKARDTIKTILDWVDAVSGLLGEGVSIVS